MTEAAPVAAAITALLRKKAPHRNRASTQRIIKILTARITRVLKLFLIFSPPVAVH